MPKPRKLSLETPTARAKLSPRKEAYFVRVAMNIALGYRRNQSGFGTWSVRFADGSPNGWLRKFGTADDLEPPNEQAKVFNYDQAMRQARTLARGEANADTDTATPATGFAPVTVSGALDRYRDDLKARGGSVYNASMPRKHLTGKLLATPVALLSADELKRWRDSLIGGELVDASINRMLKCLRAALNLAARLDQRIQNKQAWTDGLESLSDANNVRDISLKDWQVSAFVRASYAHDAALGLYVEVLADTGARPSQAARLLVSDLIADRQRLTMPKSGKGGNKDRTKRKRDRYNLLISERLAKRLKAAAAGRAPDALLLLQSDGKPWGERPSDNYGDAVAAVIVSLKLDVAATLYSLRHSSIIRALLKGNPPRVVAAAHDTSTAEIERCYSKHILDHADDLQRRTLLDHDEVADNVIAMAS